MALDLDVYWGEFLISPVPLELSLNYCSHKCAYCFANLNDPKRKADIRALWRFFREYEDRTSLAAFLFREKYPVCISNRVDPFAMSNYQQALPIIETLVDLGVPVQIQTRGGTGVDQALDLLPRSVWYVSVNTLDDDLRRRIEPGATSIESRWALIEKVTSRGHVVVLGLNPCVPDWLPDPEPLLKRAVECGVRGVWIEELHLNYNQERNLTAREREALGEELILRAKKRKKAAVDQDAFFRAREAAAGLGLEVFSNGQPTRSGFWDLYREVYPKTFPTSQDFVNLCYDQDLAGGLIPFDTYADALLPMLPQGTLPVAHYLGATAHNVWWTHHIPHQMTFRELLGIMWQDKRTRQCPAAMPAFAFAGIQYLDSGWIQVVDGNELPYMVFDPDGFGDYFTEVELWPQAVEAG